MAEIATEELDPRILRTRQLLQDGLCKLLKDKSFDEISVQDIADAATVNRATFYDHYCDKFRLLESMVGRRFHQLLTEREIQYDRTCASALKTMALAVCDYLAALPGACCGQRIEPHVESAVICVLRGMLLAGLEEHRKGDAAPHATMAAAAAWAMYGAAKEWAQTEGRPPAMEMAGIIAALVGPILQLSREGAEESRDCIPRSDSKKGSRE